VWLVCPSRGQESRENCFLRKEKLRNEENGGLVVG